MATDSWTGGSADCVSSDWSSEQPTVADGDDQIAAAGTYDATVKAGETGAASLDVFGTLQLTRAMGDGSFTDSSSGNVVIPSAGTLPCFAAGTRIRTTAGDIAVERLLVGDRATVSNGTDHDREVVWIGSREIDVAGHDRPELVAPVTVQAGAVADGLPARDLVLSPDHALVIGGKRIQVRQLINGRSITQDLACPSVQYFHVELSAHSVLLAEGMPAESYLDTGNRGAFADGVPTQADFFADLGHPATATACAPLVTDEATVRPIRQRLADRAVARGVDGTAPVAITTEADLHLIVDAKRVQPIRVEGNQYAFTLPISAKSVRLGSRSAMPSQARPGSTTAAAPGSRSAASSSMTRAS